MSPFKLSEDIEYTVTSNNWIRTGSTHSSCYRMRDGGVIVTFSGEQTLYGSYGRTEGKTVGPASASHHSGMPCAYPFQLNWELASARSTADFRACAVS